MQRSLHNVPVFRSFEPQELRRIEGLCGWKSYRPGQTIAASQEQAREVLFLTAGTARAYIASATGVVVAFGDIRPGTMFGEIAAIDGEPRPLEVEAVSECMVARLPHQEFLRLIKERPGFAMVVLTQIASNIRRLTARIFEFSTLPVKSRVHAELLRLVAHTPAKSTAENALILSPAPKHAAMAARISTHREAVTRELSALMKGGVLKKSGADLVVCDVGRLRRMLDEALAEGR